MAEAYQKLDHREHVLLRPGMYIGSVEPETQRVWVYDDAAEKMALREVNYVPGLYKIADEIIMNAVDHSVRLKRQRESCAEVVPVKRICVTVDRETGIISVENDGDGIPVKHHSEGVHVPELIFGHLLTSANYDDTSEQRTIGGQNGIGAKACNIFSKWFEVETVDATMRKIYTQRFEENMSVTKAPVIKTCAKKPYTRVTFLPDYARFGLPTRLQDDMYALLLRRVYDVTAVTEPDVSVTLNGQRVPYKSFERYCDLYLGGRTEAGRVHEAIAPGWEAVVALSDGTGLQQVSFVNGVATLRGGRHVEHFVNILVKRLSDSIEAKRKGVTVKNQFIRDNLFVFLRATVPNPAFDSQSKETLTTPVAKLGVKLDVTDKFVDKVVKLDGLIDRVIGLSDVAAEKGLKKSDGTKRSTISGIAKLDDAEWAGTVRSEQCILILTEGDSAKSMAISGLAVVGRQKYGVYPLRGKVLNVCDVSAQKIAENAEIANLKKILGLQAGKTYASVKELRYGSVMALTDADTDGSHIKGLLMNLFFHLFPSLLEIPGFLCSMLTPIVKARHARTKQELAFYSAAEFQAWRAATAASSEWKTKYYKGLGTSTAEEAKAYFKEMRLVKYVWDERSTDLMDLAFNKKRANDRKAWLGNYDASVVLDPTACKEVPYGDFVDKDLIHFSAYDTVRSIPSVVDGLKVSQRKVLFSCFKRNLREEIRVAQLAGYVSEHASYHHGEASLHSTIIGLAQDFVGSNNVNLLEPVGQFGSRLAGGANSASPRYIHTHLARITRLLFPDADDAILRYTEDDGTHVEPVWYLPVVPLILVNGATGIGTGYSTSVPCYNPSDIIRVLRNMLESLDSRDSRDSILEPWYRGFTGAIVTVNGRRYSQGVAKRLGATKLNITELPVGTWTDDFKELLESTIEKHANIKGYVNRSAERIDFTVTFADAAALDSWMAPVEVPGGEGYTLPRIYQELKLHSNKGLSTTNMHMFDAAGRIKKYDVAEILSEFFKVRLDGYTARREHQLDALSHRALVLKQKVAFLGRVIDGQLLLHTLTSGGADLDLALERLSLARFNDSYSYLTSMPMSSVSTDKKAALEKELESVCQLIADLTATDAQTLWRADLDALEKGLKL
ncbi:DNA topoisomerase 2 [Tetrabaena socialis]|uniref:DNA topoisomerase 2 n=1 Tax=Tetrabaena socialis TaxID=47790 RepID=A0A2J7ZKV5_9CHLO|nr:DNA topoisomerase 2 [Tetrabaena socialis]|eukprot:PNH00909.1 DNA topoisomerase 2 [Tetrabaena socialis]